jgi:hypothetical protein
LPAEVGEPLLGFDLGEGGATARTGLASSAVYLQKVPYLHVNVCPYPFAQADYRLSQNLVHGLVQTRDLIF